MILSSLGKVGGEDYLVKLSDTHPAAYATLLGKIIPTQVTGADGKDLIPPTDPSKIALVLLGILRGAEKDD